MKQAILALLMLPLLWTCTAPPAYIASAGAAARPITYHAQFAIVQREMQPDCTWETAPARLRQEIRDSAGLPFGVVSAWSCSGDAQAVIAELAQRAEALQAEANAYRAAHPQATTIPSR